MIDFYRCWNSVENPDVEHEGVLYELSRMCAAEDESCSLLLGALVKHVLVFHKSLFRDSDLSFWR
jgi:hypothetical protein